MIEQEMTALVERSPKPPPRPWSATHDANETIRTLELRAMTAEDRVRALEARLESARQALDGYPSDSKNLVPLRPNPTIKGPQSLFRTAPEHVVTDF